MLLLTNKRKKLLFYFTINFTLWKKSLIMLTAMVVTERQQNNITYGIEQYSPTVTMSTDKGRQWLRVLCHVQACDSAFDLPVKKRGSVGEKREGERENKTLDTYQSNGVLGGRDCWPSPGKRYLTRGENGLSDWLQVYVCSVVEKKTEGLSVWA